MNQELIDKLIIEQQNEINAYHIYKKIAEGIKDTHNKEVLMNISADELKHYEILKGYTKKDLKPKMSVVRKYVWISKIFGLTFGVKLLEKGEDQAQEIYGDIKKDIPELLKIQEDEEIHEKQLIDMLNEERLNYLGSVVLGLNDALVELTGALAGYTFAFQDTRMVALTGLITGISASFSMAASEYLSTRQDDDEDALKSALYTGMAYVMTVALLIIPFLLIHNPFVSLGTALCIAVLIIFVFNYYISVAKSTHFKKRFIEMTVISLGVAGISFVVGLIVKQVFGIEV